MSFYRLSDKSKSERRGLNGRSLSGRRRSSRGRLNGGDSDDDGAGGGDSDGDSDGDEDDSTDGSGTGKRRRNRNRNRNGNARSKRTSLSKIHESSGGGGGGGAEDDASGRRTKHGGDDKHDSEGGVDWEGDHTHTTHSSHAQGAVYHPHAAPAGLGSSAAGNKQRAPNAFSSASAAPYKSRHSTFLGDDENEDDPDESNAHSAARSLDALSRVRY